MLGGGGLGRRMKPIYERLVIIKLRGVFELVKQNLYILKLCLTEEKFEREFELFSLNGVC